MAALMAICMWHSLQWLALREAWTQYIHPLLAAFRNNVRLRHGFGIFSKRPHKKKKKKLAHGRYGNKSTSIVRFWMCSNRVSELWDGLALSVDTETRDTTERSVRRGKNKRVA